MNRNTLKLALKIIIEVIEKDKKIISVKDALINEKLKPTYETVFEKLVDNFSDKISTVDDEYVDQIVEWLSGNNVTGFAKNYKETIFSKNKNIKDKLKYLVYIPEEFKMYTKTQRMLEKIVKPNEFVAESGVVRTNCEIINVRDCNTYLKYDAVTDSGHHISFNKPKKNPQLLFKKAGDIREGTRYYLRGTVSKLIINDKSLETKLTLYEIRNPD